MIGLSGPTTNIERKLLYFLAHLTPVLLAIAGQSRVAQPNSPVPRLLGFVAQVFDTILPDLGSFRMDPALLSDAPPPPAPAAAPPCSPRPPWPGNTRR
jgi:hypothetical protein